MNRLISGAVVSALVWSAGMASADVYVVRGEFNNWGGDGDLTLNETFAGSGNWTGTASNLTPGTATEFKETTPDWSFNAPGSNSKTYADAAGNITFHFFPSQSYGDGWLPNDRPRVGYDDPHQFGWDLMGSVNNWASPFGAMTDMGGGLYQADVAIPAGAYEFKFRKAGDWALSVGEDFGNSSGNAHVNGGATVRFELDLSNGRFRTSEIPAPASAAVLGLAALAAGRRRRA